MKILFQRNRFASVRCMLLVANNRNYCQNHPAGWYTTCRFHRTTFDSIECQSISTISLLLLFFSEKSCKRLLIKTMLQLISFQNFKHFFDGQSIQLKLKWVLLRGSYPPINLPRAIFKTHSHQEKNPKKFYRKLLSKSANEIKIKSIASKSKQKIVQLKRILVRIRKSLLFFFFTMNEQYGERQKKTVCWN